MKKINWLSFASMAISLALPIVNVKLQKSGINVNLGTVVPTLPVGLFIKGLDLFSIIPIVQSVFTMIGGLTAHGSFHKGLGDWRTNYAGVIGAVFTLTAAFGFSASPEVQTMIAGFAAKIIALFSDTPTNQPA